MKYKYLFINLLLFFESVSLRAQTPQDSSNSAAGRLKHQVAAFFHTIHLNMDFKKTIQIEPFLGGSLAYASGDFIDYQKSFHIINEQGTVVDAAIQPILMATAGIQARYSLFNAGVFNKLQVSLGLQYQQNGFNNYFKSTYTAPENYTDITQYEELYQLHNLLIPIQLRWGNQWFGTLGFASNVYLSGTKTQKLHREQSGSGAVGSGFSSDLNKKLALPKSIMNSPSTLILGGGYQFNARHSVALQAHFSGNVFKNNANNFKNTTLQIIYLINLKKSNI